MKIKDLSSSNKVAGEGIIQWSINDHCGESVMVELLGYHIPKAEVRLLSPQVLLRTIGGQALQTTINIEISLDNGIKLLAIFCPRSNLPILPLTTKIQGKNKYWDNAFGYTLSMICIPFYPKLIPTSQVHRRNYCYGINLFCMLCLVGFKF
jgi:hypothetical protein